MRNYQDLLLKILEISEKMRANLDISELLDIICLAVTENLGWGQAVIVLRSEGTKISRPMAARGMPDNIRKKILNSPPSAWTQWYKIPEFKISNSFYAREMSKHMDIVPKEIKDRMLIGNGVYEDLSKWQGDDFLMIPIRAKNKWLGILNVDNPSDGKAPDIEDIRMLELFANQVSIAIRNAQVFGKQKDFNKRLAIEIEHKTKQLEEQNFELQTYISSLTHDLKTPLVSIRALIEILVEDIGFELSDDMKEIINRLIGNANKMNRLLNDLVSYYNIQKSSTRKEEFDICNLITEEYNRARDMFSYKKITFNIESDISTIYNSKLVFSLIIGNLLTNAIKFSKDDDDVQITVTIKEEPSGYIFSVKDNGIGIDMRYVDKIFMLFERLSDKKEKGTGIGLATVKKMVEKIDGKLWVESEMGKGATFYFTAPLIEKD
ncbi:MAG: GAF domain-containing sensor histidine kinase [Candidatus Methanofastidiosia archaeon]